MNRALEVNGGIKIEIKIGNNNQIKYIHRITRYDLNLIQVGSQNDFFSLKNPCNSILQVNC